MVARLPSLPAFWVGLIYDDLNLDACWEIVKDWTAEERQKLMFRVKLQGEPKVLDKYHRFVKTGVRGLGFVRTDPKIAWPEELVVKLPQ